MASQRRLANKLQKLIDAWKTISPEKSFAGMTREQFEAKVKPSLDTRGQLSMLLDQMTESRSRQRQNDRVSNNTMLLVVNAIKGDPDQGEDGALYATLGYVPRSKRRSGLTRKSNTTPPEPPAK